MPTLMVHLPGSPPVFHVLKEETTTVGRMKGNTIVIEDASVSLMHARIIGRNSEFFLKDLNSTNGTWVNGQPVGEVKLEDSDRVRLADIQAQFLADSPVSPAVLKPTVGFTLAAGTAAPPRALVSDTSLRSPVPEVSRPPLKNAGPSPGVPRSPRAKNPETRMNWSHFLSWLGAGTGAVAALIVLGFVGWRITHLPDQRDEEKGPQTSIQKEPLAGPSRPEANVEALSLKTSDNPLELAILLKSHDVAQRRQAARALHSLGPEASKAVDGLQQALKDQDDEVQMWSALALVNNQHYDKRAVPILVHVLQNEQSVLRQVACLSLGLVPYEELEREIVVPALAEIAGKDNDEDVRKAAKSALNIIAPDLFSKTETAKP